MLVAWVLVAFAVPAAIDSGLDDVPVDRRDAAVEALTLASLGCRENPIQRLVAPALKLLWLSPSWNPPVEVKLDGRPEIAARLRTYTVFGLRAGDITILDGAGISCWAVDLERDYPR